MFQSNKNRYYKYFPEELSYKEVYKSTIDKYIKNYPLFIVGVLCSVLIYFLLSSFMYTPNERRLLKEKEEMESKLNLLGKQIKDFENVINSLSTKDDSLYRIILGIDPLPSTVREAGTGGSPGIIPKAGSGIPGKSDSVSYSLRKLWSKAYILQMSFDTILRIASKRATDLLCVPAIMPIYNKDLTGTGAGFGMRYHPILHIKRMHEGIDFYARTGTDVYATADGRIEQARYSTTFGNVIVIDHGNGIETYYGHLSDFNVRKGQFVKRGNIIGYVGNTGLSSGPHLHYEVHVNNKEVNPIYYFYGDLNPDQFKEIIELSEREIYSMD